jgi:hypothetical protein
VLVGDVVIASSGFETTMMTASGDFAAALRVTS